MDKAVLMVLVMATIGCCTNKGNITYSLGEQSLLRFLNSNDWELKQICVNGNCKDIVNQEAHPFGIDTENAVPNYCTKETGDFYTIGKYHWFDNPETFEKSISIFSDPDYFKISKFDNNGNEIKIKLCTPNGRYPGTLKIIDGATIQIIANRPEYEKKEVIQVYKKKN
jgi:hypothetical protein